MATFTSNYAWTKPAGSDPVDIGVLNNNLDSQDGIMHDAFLNMADPFSESSTYAVGDIVLYGTKTYRCRVAVTTAGSWTGAANWDEHKISTLVLDNTPTDGSNNPVKSDGIYDSEKDIYAVMGQMGAKNLISYPYYEADTKIHREVTYTVNSDNTIVLSGTANGGTSNYVLHPSSQNIKYPAGTYILSGCPAGGSRTTYWMQLAHGGVVDTFDIGEGATVTLATEQVVGIGIYVAAGVDVTGKVYKPMLRLASDTDDTYQPYAKTNKQLTDEIATKVDKVTGKGLSTNDYDNTAKGIVDGVTANLALKADKTATASGETLTLVPTSEGRALLHSVYGMSVQDGTPTPSSPVDIVSAKADFRCVGKNLIPFPYYRESGYSSNGMTGTYDPDGVITINKVAGSSTAYFTLFSDTPFLLPNTTYMLSIDLENSTSTSIYINVDGTDIGAFRNKSSGYYEGTFTTPSTFSSFILGLYWSSSDVETNCIVKTMIRLASDKDGTYQPYKKHDTTTDLTLRAIEVTSSDAYNLVRDGKYYIADTLDYSEDDGWSVTRRVGEYEVLGTEGWNYVGDAGSKRVYIAQSSLGISAKSGATEQGYSSHFVYNGKTVSSITWGNYYFSGSNLVISANNSDITDITTAESWLSSNKPNFDYILVTPTTEAITTAQALALLGLKTYDESTTISSQAEPSCTVAVEYAKERLGALALTAYNTAKGNDLRITALEG